MATVKEIENQLKETTEPSDWLVKLEADSRKGVQRALKRWWTQYEKKQHVLENHYAKISFDEAFRSFPTALIAGVDEAGRGPLAGPVVTAAVILPEDVSSLIGLDDSKTVTKERRQTFAEEIKKIAVAYAVHIQPASEIDTHNIFEATRQSMEKAVGKLSKQPHFVIADAMDLRLSQLTKSIVKADEKSLAVAAASILAKTTRDEWMEQLHELFPMYHFNRNAGYGTKEHLEALKVHGPSIHHRKTFEPVKSLVNDCEIPNR